MGFIHIDKIPLITKCICFGRRVAVFFCSNRTTNNRVKSQATKFLRLEILNFKSTIHSRVLLLLLSRKLMKQWFHFQVWVTNIFFKIAICPWTVHKQDQNWWKINHRIRGTVTTLERNEKDCIKIKLCIEKSCLTTIQVHDYIFPWVLKVQPVHHWRWIFLPFASKVL